jgi:hypothetical protein
LHAASAPTERTAAPICARGPQEPGLRSAEAPAEFADLIRREVAMWSKVVKAANIKVE